MRRLHLFHDWGRWAEVETTHDSPLFPKLGTWKKPMQMRRCETCGLTKVRDLT